MKRMILLALAAAFAIPTSAQAQGASVTEAQAMELGRKYVGWFYDNQADSLWNAMTEETQGRVGNPDAITEAMNNILTQAGLEMETVGERVQADSAGNRRPVVPEINESAVITSYFDNGKVARQFEIRNGGLEGEYKEFYYSGRLFNEETFADNERQGTYTEYYPDGKVKEERRYEDGQLNGTLRKYYPSGKLKESAEYRNGARSGPRREYDAAGKLKTEWQYFDDVPVAMHKR